MSQSPSPLYTPRRSRSARPARTGWLAVGAALVFLLAALALAWTRPAAPLHRLERVLTAAPADSR